jgi:hypothetical protein
LEDVYRSPEDVPGDWRTPAGVQRTCQEIGERLQQSRGCARRLEDVSSSPEDRSTGPEDTPFGGQRTYTEDVLAYMYDAILQA